MPWVLWRGMPLQVYDPEVDQDRGFGLLGNSDHLWTSDQRETQKHQVGGCGPAGLFAHLGLGSGRIMLAAACCWLCGTLWCACTATLRWLAALVPARKHRHTHMHANFSGCSQARTTHVCDTRTPVQVKRATKFLNILFEHAPEPVVLVVTHSGFARSLLLAMQREPYRPQNAELIPAIVEQTRKKGGQNEADDSWIDEVLDRHAALLQQQDEEEKGVGRHRSRQDRKQSPCILRRAVAWTMQRVQQVFGGRQ